MVKTFAFLILCICLAGSVFASNPNNPQLLVQNHNENATLRTSIARDQLVPTLDNAIDLSINTQRKIKPDNNEIIKLSSNSIWDIISTLIAAISSFIVAIFTISLAKTNKKLWTETKSANEIARKSAEIARQAANATEHTVKVTREAYIASERPWLSVNAIISSDLVRKNEGIEFGLNFLVTNYGKSPALNVHVFHKILTLRISQDFFSNARQRIDELGYRTDMGRHMGIDLFPAETKPISWVNTLDIKDIEESLKAYTPPNDMLPSIFIIGSVFYEFPFDNEKHKTDFTYYLKDISNPLSPRGSDLPNFKDKISKEKLALELFPNRDNTIN